MQCNNEKRINYMAKRLSKSRYTTYCQCPKALWLKVYKPDEATVDAGVEARFESGNVVGDLAMQLFGDFKEVTTYKEDGSLDLNKMAELTRQYMDRKTGEQRVINTVVLKLTDGTDTFLGEITGERAVNCPKYDPQYIYKVQCSMVVREWDSTQTGEHMSATTIYVDKINMM